MEKFFPGLAGRFLAHTGYQSQQTDEPRDPDRPNNLWDPVPGDQGTRGAFSDRSRDSSLQFWVAKHRNALAASLASALTLAVTALVARSRS